MGNEMNENLRVDSTLPPNRRSKQIKTNHFKLNIMGNYLYVIAVLFFIVWVIGFFGYHAGAIIHIALVFALITFLARFISGRKRRRRR